MLFVDMRPGDLEKIISASERGYDKLPGPSTVEEQITGVDQAGEPRIVMRAEKVAIVYLTMDHAWQNPSMRWNMIESAYKEMRKRLLDRGILVAYCFFSDGVPNGYIRRLVNEMGADRIIDRCVRFTAGR